MTQVLVEREVNLKEYPAINKHLADKKGRLTLGDMHGNALKFINALMEQGFTNIDKKDYDNFCDIYAKNTNDLTHDDLKRFNEILDKATYNKAFSLSLLGDLLGDRGSNDYFTLKILAKLLQNKIPFEILLSNHDVEFIKAYESTPPNFVPSMLMMGHAASLQSLKILLEKGLVKEDEIIDLVNQVYKPNLVAIAYTLDDKGITIYTHGDYDIEDIQYLAESLSLEFKDNTSHELAHTIDNLNDYFRKNYVDKNRVHELFPEEAAYNAYLGKSIDRKLHPFINLTWNRDYHRVKRSPVHKGYPVRYVHGHDGSDPSQDNIVNLDYKNTAGKMRGNYEGEASVLFTDERKLQELAAPEYADRPLTTTLAVERIIVPPLERAPTPILEDFNLLFPPKESRSLPDARSEGPRYFMPVRPSNAERKPSLGEEMEKMAAKIHSDSLKEVIKAPSRNPVLAGLLVAAIALPIMAYFWGPIAIAYSLFSGLFATGLLSLRNDFYDDNAVCIQAAKNKGEKSYDQKVFEKGLAAGLSFTPYLQSFFDKAAWKDPFTFGAGLRQSLVDEKEKHSLRK